MKLSHALLGASALIAPLSASAQLAAEGFAAPPASIASQGASEPRFALAVPPWIPDYAASSSSREPATIALDELPDAPSTRRAGFVRPPLAVASHTGPFSTVALAVTFGSGGVGIDVATPLNTKFNLRGGAGFLNYTTSFVATVPITGTLQLRNVHGVVDWFPWGKAFHISPGVTFYQSNRYDAFIYIPGGQVVAFSDQNYTSDPNDPVHGTADVTFGNQVAPRLTVGWGNMIPHTDKNWTFPFEIGAEYVKPPVSAFTLLGSSCDAQGDCGSVQNDPDTQANVLQQQIDLTNELRPLRFFPVISIGVSYKFGH